MRKMHRPHDGSKRVYIYTRVSTQEQAEHRTSLDQQERDARHYCDDRGYTVVDVFQDGGISGSDRSRPSLERMLLLACSDDHPVDVIVACDLASIARDLEFSIVLRSQLKRAGVELQLVYQTFEDSHSGQLHQILTAWQDEDAIIKAAANTRRGLR